MESKHKLKHRFDIIRKLGQGTYGKVQLAVNKETGQEVAIKTIKKSKIENEQDAVRIRREIQIMSSIRHPNIVHIYEVFENKDKIVLVMQNASGGELYEYLSERKVLNDAEARRIFRQVVAAVYYIHKNKICHRDLKLENILLDEKGNAKIADFGLSNVYDEKGLLSTFCGSPLYASPEIVKGLPYFGPEVDCWSLGVLLYTLVYGAMPFDGSNFKKLVKQISNGDYFEPKLRSAASGLIRHLLTVNASERASIVDVCRNDWVNETYDTQLLQVAEDLANLSPVRLDLLIALQPQGSTTQIEQSSQQQQQPSPPGVTTQIPGSPGILNGKLPPTPAPTDRPTEFSQNSPQEQVLQSPSLMRMPSLSVKNCASLGTLRSSSSASSVKSALSVDMRAGGSNHSDDAGSTTSCNSFQASPNLVAESDLRERQADPLRQQQTPAAAVQSAESFLSSKAAIELGPKDLAKMSLKSSDTSPRKPGPQSVPGNNKVQSGIGADYSLDDQRTSSDVQTHNGPDGLQHVQIISRKTETPRCKDESSEDSPRSLVWPAGDDSKVTSPLKKPHGRLSPEGAPDDSTTERVLRETRGGGDALNEVPRGLPMKSYKKFTFERNGGQVVVREKICQKEHRDGNRKTVIEKKVTSRTSSIDMLPPTPSSPPVAAGTEGFESPMTRASRRDDSSDEDDFDIHFDSSHGPLGLLNVMKFMDRDFRTRWQNHPIFQNLSRRPLGMTSELMQNLQGNRRLHSPSLMKMFIERDSRDDDVKSLFERRLSPLLNHSNDRSMFASSLPTDPAARRNLERKLSRGSSLDRSSSRTPRMPPVHQQQQQSSVVDPMTAAAYEGFSGSFRDIPRYSRTVSDKTIGESHQPSPQSPTAVLRTRTQQGRPSVLHMELNFNTRHPASVGLVHSWSNHGLWQQQNHNQPHQNTTPSRIEMRVHYSTPSSPPPTASPVGMPPKPPKSMSQEQLQTRNPPPPPPPPSSSMEESVSDRINRRSYYHRFSSVDKQTRPSSTIWDQQGAAGSMSAGAGALWEAASPDKPLGISSRASMTKPPPPPQESNSTSM